MQDPTAVVGRRFLAFVIDAIILAVLVGAIAGALFADNVETKSFRTSAEARQFCDVYNGDLDEDGDLNGEGLCGRSGNEVIFITEDDLGAAILATSGVSLLVYLLNPVLLQGLTGGSVGKLITGLRVLRENGRKAGIGWCALRTLLLIVDLGVCFLIGPILILTTKGHRRVGDLAAKTLVVPKTYEGHQLAVPGVTVPESAAYVGAGWAAPGSGVPPSTPPPGASTGGWTAPSTPTPDQPAAAPSGDGPHWDEARQAYLQYDHARGAWLQWDDTAKEWKQI